MRASMNGSAQVSMPMKGSQGTEPPIPAAVIDEAIGWAVKMNFNKPGGAVRQAFDTWLNRDPLHARAWARVQSLRQDFTGLPPKLAMDTLQAAEDNLAKSGLGRRQMLKILSLAGVAIATASVLSDRPLGQSLLADASTATGERRSMTLSDGTLVVLNTNTAIDIDLDGAERSIALLRGEIMVATGADAGSSAKRSFHVDTALGRIQALGTRFAVRKNAGDVCLTVQEGAVRMHSAQGGFTEIARPGESWKVRKQGFLRVTSHDFDPTGWMDGIIEARQMPLARLLAELNRYRRGYIFCDDSVASLRVTGTYQTGDTDRTLEFLANTLPVSISRRTRYWVTVNSARTNT